MLNSVLIALAIIFYFKNNNTDYKKLLNSLTLDDVAMLLSAFGADEKITAFISEGLPNLLSGNADINSLFKTVVPLIMSLSQDKNENISENKDEKNGLEPIKNISDAQVTDALNAFFE